MKKATKPRKSKALPTFETDVHTEHCCVRHGCAYGQDFNCSVVNKEKPQSYICESCAREGIINLDILKEVQNGGKPHCPHCGHILP